MTHPLRLLLIDDNRSDRLLVIRELEREFDQVEIREIISSGEFNRAIAESNFDAVITDFQLRWTTGLEILDTVKQHYPRCPVVMFTNTGTEEIAVEAMKLGLDDYIIKEPGRYVRVPASVQIALERSQAQQRAALTEIRLQNLLEQIKVGVFRFNAEGTLLETNPAFLELLGAESLAQANEQNLIPTYDCFRLLLDLPPPQRQEQELQLQRSDGTQYWALLTTTLNIVEGITVADGLLEDISDRKQAEFSLQQQNVALETQVEAQTTEVRAVNQDLEELTDSISNQLQTPLQTIQTAAQSMLRDLGESLDTPYLNALQQITASAQQLDALIAELVGKRRA